MPRSSLFGFILLACLIPAVATAAPITLSGTITYPGPYDADSLYVAVIDTTGEDVQLFSVLAFDIGDSPVSQPYTFNLDSSTAPPYVWIASLLDVDGGGTDFISAVDVVGWYDANPIPAVLSTATSQSGLNFALPTGEIHGTLTFAPDQDGAEIWASPFSQCFEGGTLSRPSIEILATGPYEIVGLYAGSYCIFAYGWGTGPIPSAVCYGDYTCESPSEVMVGEGQTVNGINISFVNPLPAAPSTWGRLKTRYP